MLCYDVIWYKGCLKTVLVHLGNLPCHVKENAKYQRVVCMTCCDTMCTYMILMRNMDSVTCIEYLIMDNGIGTLLPCYFILT